MPLLFFIIILIAGVEKSVAKSYQDYLFELSKKSNTLQTIDRSETPQVQIGKSGALFFCSPYCEWISFFGKDDSKLSWKFGAILTRLRVVFSDDPEFKSLFPDAPNDIQNPLIHEVGPSSFPLSGSFRTIEKSKSAKDFQISFQSVLGLAVASTDIQSDSNLNTDAKSNPYLRYLIGFSLNLDTAIQFFDNPWLQKFEVQMEKSADRVSKNSSDNSSSLSDLQGRYVLLNSKSKNYWGPFISYSQSSRRYKNRSIQAISTEFQEIWVGGRYQSAGWTADLSTNAITMAKDEDAFRTSPQEFKRLRIELEKCFTKSELFGGQLKYCAHGLYELSQEKTNLSEQISPISVRRQFTETNYGLGLKIYFEGAQDE